MTSPTKSLASASYFALLLLFGFGVASADARAEGIAFTITNLDSNVSGRATFTDPNTQNAWGIAFAPGSPFWVNDNHAGVATPAWLSLTQNGLPGANAIPHAFCVFGSVKVARPLTLESRFVIVKAMPSALASALATPKPNRSRSAK